MPPIKPVRKFQVTIAQLIAICRLCWLSCLENIAAFTAFKTFYDAAFVTAAQDAINDAEAMPSDEERTQVHEALRVQLREVGENCLVKWRMLRGYIRSAFEEEYIDMDIAAAGGNEYDSAYHENWEDVQQMMTKGKNFITANTAPLAAGGMAATFAADFDAAYTAFLPKYNAFKDAQMDAEEGTMNRTIALNDIYDAVQAMNADGQIIFESVPQKFDRFVFARVKEKVDPSGGETILLTEEGSVDGGMTKNIANLPAECTKVRMFVPGLGPLQYSFSLEGTTPNGNTVSLGDNGQTTATVAEFASAGTIFIVKNLNGGTVGYKVEFIK